MQKTSGLLRFRNMTEVLAQILNIQHNDKLQPGFQIWIRIRIESVYTEFQDPDTDFEFESGSRST